MSSQKQLGQVLWVIRTWRSTSVSTDLRQICSKPTSIRQDRCFRIHEDFFLLFQSHESIQSNHTALVRKSETLQLGLLSDFVVAIPLARKIKDVYNAHFQANCWGVTSTQDFYTKTLLPSTEFFTVHNYSQWVSEGNFSPSTAGMVRTAHQRGVYVRESGLNCRVQVKSWTLNMHQRHLNASSHSCFRD